MWWRRQGCAQPGISGVLRTPDPRYRALVKKFAEAGYLESGAGRLCLRDPAEQRARRWNMSRIRGKNPTPEMAVSAVLYAESGYHFSCMRRKLPGRPDVVLPKRKTVVFVHELFFLASPQKVQRTCATPTNRRAWWLERLEGNAARDRVHRRALSKLGWKVVVVWECEN